MMKWITRERVKVDRVACPWLIRNFIDPDAQFVFLPHDSDWSAISDGIVYDVPNCELGHHGEDVSFDSIMKKYKVNDPALTLLAEIVRAADSHLTNPHSAGEGLRWIAHGVWRCLRTARCCICCRRSSSWMTRRGSMIRWEWWETSWR